MTTPRFTLAVVGNGDAARSVLKSANDHGGFDLVAVADPEPRARERFAREHGGDQYGTLAELLARHHPDAVYIATPTKFHEDHARESFAAGAHVFVEKPIASTLESAERMVEAATTAGKHLIVDHKRSVDPPIVTMWHVIASGEFGAVRAVHRWHYSDWFYRPRGEDERDSSDGGVVLRQGAHEFDVLRLLSDGATATSLRGQMGDYDEGRPGEGAYSSWLNYDSGLIATSLYGGYGYFATGEFTNGLGAPERSGHSRRKLEAVAPTAAVEAELKRENAGVQTVEPSNGVYGFTLVNCERGDMRPAPGGSVYVYGRSGRREVKAAGPFSTNAMLAELHAAIAGRAMPMHDAAWGIACLEQCLAIRDSGAAGREVELTHQPTTPREAIEALCGGRELKTIN